MAVNQTHGNFKDILAVASPELRPACGSLRSLVSALHPGFLEVVWPKHKIASFGVGPKKMTQHYAYISVQSSHVNLGFYHGASLSDPANLLKGTGKALRHIKIHDASSTRDPQVVNLLRQAIAERRPYG